MSRVLKREGATGRDGRTRGAGLGRARWSPDGCEIVRYLYVGSGHTEGMLMPAEGGAP